MYTISDARPRVQLSAWKSITQLSHALESTLGLLCVTLQDGMASQPPSLVPLSGYNLRQCYSTAIIRLVNGLVDPLQSGVYARSIASIAAQLGLPAWLVEVRHAATHEELPSLQVLREAAHEVIFPFQFRLWNRLADAPESPLVPNVAIPQLFHAGVTSLVAGTCSKSTSAICCAPLEEV